MIRFSQMVAEHPYNRIEEIDLNPLLASSKGLLALDGRASARREPASRPTSKASDPSLSVAVRFTIHHEGRPGGYTPIRPEDEPLMGKFHGTLSERSVYMRYFSSLSLTKLTCGARASGSHLFRGL